MTPPSRGERSYQVRGDGHETRLLEVRSRGEWRSWLSSHHDTCREIWLVFRKVSAGSSAISYDDAVTEALCFGWIDGLVRRLDEARYARRFTPRRPGSSWSALNRARAGRAARDGLMTAPGLRMVRLARESGAWDGVSGKPAVDPAEMPAELVEALAADAGALGFFAALPPSAKRLYILWVATARRPGTRKRRASEAARLLGRGERLGPR